MGNDASCCGAPEKTTRTGGKVSYGDKKKRHRDTKDKQRRPSAQTSEISQTRKYI